ncbi:MAG TPA: hypothetical protein VFV38_51100 [Ktedonobacteraceae bacterium]|nr:hypothetical protein [Ktedonobacteraceae bacterium]
MSRSKYIADQAVEAARLCVLHASDAERRAMVAMQEAERLNNRFVVQAGRDAAREGYKAAQAGQNATVVGQRTAVWEDPNLPPKDIIRQLEYVARLIDSVVDKAAEVAYAAARIAQDLRKKDFTDKTDEIAYRAVQIAQDLGKKDLSKELEKGRGGQRNFWKHLIVRWAEKVQKLEPEDVEAQFQERLQDYNIEAQLKERTRKQTDLKHQVHLSTRKLANILANHEMSKDKKFSRIEKEAQHIFSFIGEAEGTAGPEEGHWNPRIHYVVMLASQQVTLANYICALVASRLPQAYLKTLEKKEADKVKLGISYLDEMPHIRNILAYAEIDVKYMEIIERKTREKFRQWSEKVSSLYKKEELASDEDEPEPIIEMDTIIDIDIRRIEDELNEKLLSKDGKELDARKTSQLIDETASHVVQAMDTAVAKVDKSILHLDTLIDKATKLINSDTSIAKSDKSIHRHEDIEHPGLENLMDQLSTLASRVAILAYQERIVVWGEGSEEEKEDNPQVLKEVAQQVDKLAKTAAQAAEYASQAAKRAGQSATQLMPDLSKSFQISNRLTQILKWRTSVPPEVREHIGSARSLEEMRSSLDEIQRMCREADTACKEAMNVYEKIEQARRDAEQFCKKGTITVRSVSWWPIWPWPSPTWLHKWLWPALSNSSDQPQEPEQRSSDPPKRVQWLLPNPSHNQSQDAAKQASEAVDQVGQAAVLAGQAVAQSGQAVAQASLAVAILGQVITRHSASNSPVQLRILHKQSFLWDKIIPIAQQVGESVARAGQMASQASQAANNVAKAAQATQKMAKTAQAVQQVEWLIRGRQKWIFWLGIILSSASIIMLLLLPFLINSPILYWVIMIIGIGAIVDSYLLIAALVENIKKMRQMFHRILTLVCCALLFLLVGFLISYTFFRGINIYNTIALSATLSTIRPGGIPRTIALVTIALLIVLPPSITGIVYYQHCTLNNLHPPEDPTSALEN